MICYVIICNNDSKVVKDHQSDVVYALVGANELYTLNTGMAQLLLDNSTSTLANLPIMETYKLLLNSEKFHTILSMFLTTEMTEEQKVLFFN